jgi:hypothetical protein
VKAKREDKRVMLKITEICLADGGTILRLEGRISGPWVDEVRRSCERVLARGWSVTLDLYGVSFIERSAEPLLRELMSRPVIFINCSAFLIEQFKDVQS